MKLSGKSLHRQRGMSAIGLIFMFVMGGAILLLGLKVFPAYTDYFVIKKVIAAMAGSDEVRSGTVADIRRSFDKRMAADYSDTLKGDDLDITKEGNETVVSATWAKRIPLFTNHALVIDFSTSTAGK
jgi:hypothetical protein